MLYIKVRVNSNGVKSYTIEDDITMIEEIVDEVTIIEEDGMEITLTELLEEQ